MSANVSPNIILTLPHSPHRFKPKSHTRRSSHIVSSASWSVMQHAHRDSLSSSFSSYLYLSHSHSLSFFILISDELGAFDPFCQRLETIIVMYPVRAGIPPECSKPAPKRGTESPLRSKSSTTSLVTAGKMNALPRWVHAGIHEWYCVVCFWRSLIWTLLVSSICFHCQSIHVSFLRAWTSDSQCRASFNLSLTWTGGCKGGTSFAVLMFWDGEVIALLMNNNLNVAMVGSTLVEPWHLRGVLVRSDITDLRAFGGPVDQNKGEWQGVLGRGLLWVYQALFVSFKRRELDLTVFEVY